MKISTKKGKTDVKVIFVDEDQAAKVFALKILSDNFSFYTTGTSVYVATKSLEDSDDWRNLGYKLIKYLKKLNIESVSIPAPKYLSEFTEGLYLGDYTFTLYKSKDEDADEDVDDTGLDIRITSSKFIDGTLRSTRIKTEAQNLVRDMVNGTAEDMNSYTITCEVEKIFENTDIRVNVYGKQSLYDFGMRGHLAVNRASVNEAVTIKLEYRPKRWKKHIVLIGKGLTYDTGGLSIKPTSSMLDMKCDKGGAMTVIGIMKAIEELGVKYKVTAYLALAENSIAGNAYRPGDVLTMKNGKTVHVKNTDAEGRIVLFDNLCLAEEQNPKFDEMYTFATLTGAALASFGAEAAGMVGFNDDMKAVIKQHGLAEGEYFMNAEFHKYMLDGVDDSLADLSNTGTQYQGCHKAGLFLTNALTEEGKKKYLHLDIAGPAFASSAFGSNPKGGTGFAVRTFIRRLQK